MSFKFISPQPIKSDSQRALAFHWDRLAAGRRFPRFVEFTPEPGAYDPKHLVVWNIEGEGHQLKFRALYQGQNVAEVFSSAWAGKTMDQVVPISLRRITLDAARECASSGCLIYTVISTIDTNGRQVDCERLLLPFGRDGSKVEQILASLQLTKFPGGIRRDKILNNFQMQADLLFSGKIKSGFTKTNPASTIPAISVHGIASGTHPDPSLRISNDAPALSTQAEAAIGENRRAARRNVLRAGRISFGKESMTCTIRNLSATGASMEGASLIRAPDIFRLVLEMESAERLCTVVWRKKAQIGVRFSPIPATTFDRPDGMD
jgi:hypothetical protein